MSNPSTVTQFKRPRILVKAAQIAMENQNRNKVLTRLLNCSRVPTIDTAISILSEREVELNQARLGGDASYNIQRHIAVLAALLGEMRLQQT
jgi:hypothetical protein